MNRSLIDVMQALYSSEINVRISCMWDGGWQVSLGDELNGVDATADFENERLGEAAEWLAHNARRLYPRSSFAKTFVRHLA